MYMFVYTYTPHPKPSIPNLQLSFKSLSQATTRRCHGPTSVVKFRGSGLERLIYAGFRVVGLGMNIQ